MAVEGNKVIPGLTDHYLARTNYEAQQTDEPVEPDRRDNLWEPVPGDHGAHGAFDECEYYFSPQLWANTHRRWLAVAGAGLAGFACAMLIKKQDQRTD